MTDTDARPSNRLAHETSPYLLQHAHNPVDWYPWSDEALQRAREADRPIFLSIGYAACHWCHVMERESFEDTETAAYLNEHFVSIKVDREERPDLDAIYMDAVQALTGQGGWPMSVFLTPDGEPFYGGTYFPDRPRHGMPAFRQILEALAHAWEHRRDEVQQAGRQLAHAMNAEARSAAPADGGLPPTSTFDAATAALERSFDRVHGGFGGAPKFPPSMALEFLLQEHVRSGDTRALAMARRTLDAMADGGIYDHLGGGFARYATDAIWLVPHFEKMLYDNALLARVYLHAWQVTGAERYRAVVEETLDYVVREMRVGDGGFASSQDADTDHEEGLTYVWTLDEVREILGDHAPLFSSAYDVTATGNWEGHVILRRVRDDRELAGMFGLEEDAVTRRLADARMRLFERRRERPQPGRDDKVIASWNGLMLAAFAEAGRVLRRDDYRAIATQAAEFLLTALVPEDGRLRRSWKDGRTGPLGVLEDHTHLADGLLALYEATFDERWFVAARRLADHVLERFGDPQGGWFDTAHDAERLVARPKGVQDNATPSGNAVATGVLLRLAALTGEGRYRSEAERALGLVAPVLGRYPTGFAQWLCALQLALARMDEVAIVGDPAAGDTAALLDVVFQRYRPHQVVAVARPDQESAVPLLADRPQREGLATAYVCHGFACQQPVTEATALAAQLSGATTGG